MIWKRWGQTINKYIAEQEAYWKECEEDLARWNDYLIADDVIPHEEVSKWLDSISTENEKPCPIK